MDDLRVPTLSLPVRITCCDGQTVTGDIFMPAQSSRHPGPMYADEWTDTSHVFFPLRLGDAQSLTLMNRASVVAISVPAEANGDASVFSDQPVSRLKVDACGAHFEGDIVIDMPSGQQRVADWLNAPGDFFTLRAGATHHLIQKRHVTRVVELDGSSR